MENKVNHQETAFQMLLHDAGTLAEICIKEHLKDIPSLVQKSDVYYETLTDTVMLYLSSWFQADISRKKSIYGYINKKNELSDAEKTRQYYRHESMIRRYNGREDKGEKRRYDAADFIAIENRINFTDPLTERVFRQNIHKAKNFSNSQFAEAFKMYDEEYALALEETDAEKYVANSVHFYRKENSTALSLIAHIVEYMRQFNYKEFDFELANLFWTEIPVENFYQSEPQKTLVAAPNVLTYFRYIPNASPEHLIALSSVHALEQILEANKMQAKTECAARALKQNVFELLPLPERKYGDFDIKEVAEFIHKWYPIIESHRPVSFYEDKSCTRPDSKKIKLARNIMKDFYVFAKNENGK